MSNRYTERQRRIAERLARMVGDGEADMFVSALGIISRGDDLPAGSMAVWHFAREISGALLNALWSVAPTTDSDDESSSDETEQSADNQKRRITHALEVLGLDPANSDIAWWADTGLHRLAHRRQGGPPRPFRSSDWSHFESAIDQVLMAYEAVFHLTLDRLDALLEKGASAPNEEVEDVLCRVAAGSRAVALRHFFRKADGSWVDRIPKCVLRAVPRPQNVLDQPGWIWWPSWPVTEYLARTASARPDQVFSRIRSLMKEPPDNPRLHRDLAEAAISLKLAQTAEWATQEAVWVRTREDLPVGIGVDLSKVAAHLIDAKEWEPGFELTRALLALEGSDKRGFGAPPMRMDEHDYARALTVIVPAIQNTDPRTGLDYFADLLADGIDRVYPGLYSAVAWLDAFDDLDDRASILVRLAHAVRDLAHANLDRGESAKELIDSLLARSSRSPVFNRIALELARAPAAANVAEQLLADPATYDTELLPEAAALLAHADLTRNGILDDIERAIRATDLRDATIDALLKVARARRAGDDETAVEAARIFEFHRPTVERVEPPVEAATLASLSVVDALASLRSEPDGAVLGSKGALLGAFRAAVEAAAPNYSREIDRLADQPPEVVGNALSGLRAAAKSGTRLSWRPVLRFARRHLRESGRWDGGEWSDVRKDVAWLLLDALGSRPIKLPLGGRDDVWAIIEGLLADPSPTPDQDQRNVEGGLGLVTATLNLTRSIAVSCATQYAVWMKHQGKVDGALPPEVAGPLDAVVRDDPSRIVRAALGRELPLLAHFDESWVGQHAAIIFLTDRSSLADAAWEGLLTTPYHVGAMIRVLEAQYADRVDTVAADSPRDSDEQLGQHLVLFYARGDLSLEPTGLVARYFYRVNDATALRVIHTIGWGLWRSRDQARPPEILERWRKFWAWVAARAEAKHRLEELGTFTWWFASGLFDDDWAFEELRRVAAIDAPLDAAHVACDRLSGLVEDRPLDVGRTLDLMLARTTDDGEFIASEDSVAAIARALVANSDADVRQLSQSIRNRLVGRGRPDPLGQNG